MADPFTDYASSQIWNLLLQSPFVDFSLAIGVSIFLMYFYKTKYWKSSDWAKIIIFGLFMGFFIVGVLDLAIFPLSIPLNAMHAQFLEAIMFYPLPIIFLIYLFRLRFETVKAPLCSEQAKWHFRNFLSIHRTYWTWLLIAVSITVFISFSLAAVFTAFLNVNLGAIIYFGFILLFINYVAIGGYILILTFIAQMSFFAFDTEALNLAIKSCFYSFNQQRVNVKTIIEDELKYGIEFSQKRRRRFNRDFLHKLTLLILIVIVVVALNGTYQILTPSVSSIETQSNNNQINVYRFDNGTFLYTVQMEKTYEVNLPMIPTQIMNLVHT